MLKRMKAGFFWGIGFCLAVSFYYVFVSLIAGLIAPLLVLAFGMEFPEWFAWSAGIVVFALIGTWFFYRKTKTARVLLACLIAGILIGSGFYASGLNKTSVAAQPGALEEVEGYTLKLYQDYRAAGLVPCTSISLALPQANDGTLTDPDFLFNLLFGNCLAGAVKKDSARCRIRVIPEPNLSAGRYFVEFGTTSRQILVPLEMIDGKVFSESFVGVRDGGGLPLPGMHELIFTKPYKEPVCFRLVRYKDS